jgi:galactokinase
MKLEQLKSVFSKFSNVEPRLFKAPGRINLIGDHTDYNEGYVMPASINRFAYMALNLSQEDKMVVHSIDFDETFMTSIDQLERNEISHWSNYFIGVLSIFKSRGVTIQGIDCAFSSDVPLGAGLSSSAALTCCFAYGLNELFGGSFSKEELVDIAQETEHRFALVNCGNMDQTASIFGKEGQAMLFDCKTREIKYSPLNVGEYEFLLVDTKVKHSLADSAYNDRRHDCESGVAILKRTFPEVSSLRDVSLAMLDQSVLPDLINKRCQYVIQENERVKAASQYLLQNNLFEFGGLMRQSHVGLSTMYEVSCDELDFIIEKTKMVEDILGARMMGGGFGGCCIVLIQSENVGTFKSDLENSYTTRFKQKPAFYSFKTSNGVEEIK